MELNQLWALIDLSEKFRSAKHLNGDGAACCDSCEIGASHEGFCLCNALHYHDELSEKIRMLSAAFSDEMSNGRYYSWMVPQVNNLLKWAADNSIVPELLTGCVCNCKCCGNPTILSPFKDSDGNVICETCFHTYYYNCSECGHVHLLDNMVVVNAHMRGEKRICTACLVEGIANRQYFKCSDCGQYYSRRNCDISEGEINICSRCSHRWATCNRCGSARRTDDGSTRQLHNGGYVCVGCYDPDMDDDENRHIHNYSYKPDPLFYRTPEENGSITCYPHPPLMYFGVELEIDAGKKYGKCQDDLYALGQEDFLFYQKHDGSLGEKGIEIVTHPCTLDYHLANFPWAGISDIARTCGFKSDTINTCGLHVHVSRNALGDSISEQEATIAKIILMVDRFWDKLGIFSRRDLDESRWARKPNADIKPGDSLEIAIDKAKEANDDRYHAVNLMNDYTIEFRMFKGTLDMDTLKASLQFVNNICQFARHTSLEHCLDANWGSVAQYRNFEELNQYLEAMGLKD